MKKILPLLLMLSLTLNTGRASAVLLDLDRNTAGDAELLLDTTTGLVWLDLSITAEQSYNYVLSQIQSGGVYDGFRFATRDEVLQLWAQASISDTAYVWLANGEWLNVKSLADRLGTSTLFDPYGLGTHALGIVDGETQLPPNERRLLELSYHSNGVDVRTSSNYYTIELDFATVHNSSYLIRIEPVVAGDVAPLGAPDGTLNTADLYVMTRIVLGIVAPDTNTLAYGDVYPVGNPDGLIDVSDLLQLYRLVSGF